MEQCKMGRVLDWKVQDWKGVGLEGCRIERDQDWKSAGFEVCKIGRVKDWKGVGLEE